MDSCEGQNYFSPFNTSKATEETRKQAHEKNRQGVRLRCLTPSAPRRESWGMKVMGIN